MIAMDEKGNLELLNTIETMEDILDSAMRIRFPTGERHWCRTLSGITKRYAAESADELKQAKNLLNDRKNILYIAKKEAEDTVHLAEERAKKILDQSEIMKQAQDKANEIITQAHMQAREIKKATNDFVEQRLADVENTLLNSLNQIRETKKALKPAK